MATTSGANHSATVAHHHRTETGASRSRHQARTSSAIETTAMVASSGEPPLADRQATPGHSTCRLGRGSAPEPHEAAASSTPPAQPTQRQVAGAPAASAMGDRLVTPREQPPPLLRAALHRHDVRVVEAAGVEELRR